MTITVSLNEHQEFGTPSTNLKGYEKPNVAAPSEDDDPVCVNPVLRSSKWALQEINLVKLDEDGITSAARYIHSRMHREAYVPRSWRDHALHICPEEPFSWASPSTRPFLDWIFLISSLNFSFWSELEGTPRRFGIKWREGWKSEKQVVHTGYWSLVAAVNRALEAGLPVTDPEFYSSPSRCPDSMVAHIFRVAEQSDEGIPLLSERVSILRENGDILRSQFDGSFYGFVQAFRKRYNDCGTALQLVQMVTETFPSFRDEHVYNGRRVHIWKRAQILVAETWAALYPASPSDLHPLFPSGPKIQELTMFADYRVPQVLHRLRILSYPPSLVALLEAHTPLESGSKEELSIRAASIIGVERVREEIVKLVRAAGGGGEQAEDTISSVVIDFYLWDLAKRVEGCADELDGIQTAPMVPIHRTRSIWY
ncbi:uncharacterized protein BXZ73DRAFT_76811 [Epithele typhae]|uniref:uncharacterized protein n=1 Tax=Epithele typhae TaxID=378194 RepID=UPI002007A490|nr:uncharacterized protein BXZ73DRAFT_76811 [Epithele typhae]KAH9935097.1 hypothetical protein BXZ73DRAFT_76811 [Epithele typhae]